MNDLHRSRKNFSPDIDDTIAKAKIHSAVHSKDAARDLSANPDISIIIVSWNVKDLLRCAIDSIIESLDLSQKAGHILAIEIIVVDNASTDGSADFIIKHFPQVKLVANNTNKGFGAANNQGFKIAAGDYILCLNPDAKLIGEALRQMHNFMREQPFVGLLGPKLVNQDSSLQRSCRRFPTFWSMGEILLKLHNFLPMSLPIRRYYMWAFDHQTVRRVDQVMGACMMIRRSALNEVGYFDEEFFIFFEEVDLCKRLTDAGHIIFFYPYAVVEHHRSSGFAQRHSLWRQWHFAKSCRHYFWKHHNFVSASLITVLSFFSLWLALLVAMLDFLKIKISKKRDL